MTGPTGLTGMLDAAGSLAGVARELGRDDVTERIAVICDRVERAATFVVVLGEFKQGKSSLVNALLDATVPLCPVDDDTATATVTLVQHGDAPSAAIAGTVEGRVEWHAADLDEAHRRILAGDVEQVRLVDGAALLASGITLVDTPGVGGLDGGHTRASLAFLPHADAVLFVSDATAELSAAELAWYRAAADACAVTIPVLTKTDLAPAWRRIADLDAGHLASVGRAGSVVPVSATAYATARELGDAQLAADSGIPLLRRTLAERVADPARARAARAGATEVRRLARQLAAQVAQEHEQLADPGAAAAAIAAAQERLAHLRGPAARWQQRLNDASTDIAQRATFDLRATMRTLSQSLDDRVGALESPADWDGFSSALQADLADAVTAVFAQVHGSFADLRGELYGLVADESPPEPRSDALGLTPQEVGGWLEVGAGDEPGAGTRAMTAIRGAQSGLMMFGFLGQLLPAAAGALLLSSPLTLALGGAFAGKALLDVRKRSLTARRNQAKQAARKLLDDAQFELANRVAELTRTGTRELRDEIGEQLALAQRSAQEAARAAQDAAEHTAAERVERTAVLRRLAGDLRSIDAALRPEPAR